MGTFSKAKQMLLNEARKCQTKADSKKREAIKLEAESAEYRREADKL